MPKWSHGNDPNRVRRDRNRRLAMTRDVPTLMGIIADITEAVEFVGIVNPPPPQDRRCVVCGALNCGCEQPGGRRGGRSPGVSDPTLGQVEHVEDAITRARGKYAEFVRDVVEVAGQLGVDAGRLEEVAVALDPACPECGHVEGHPLCDHPPSGRPAWLRHDRAGRSTLTGLFRATQQRLQATLSDIQDRWMRFLQPGDDGNLPAETAMEWSQQSVHQLLPPARAVLRALTTPNHPDAGRRPPTCRCKGTNCDHGPGGCDELTSGRCDNCRQRDSRANRAPA